jgi:hypothetical protein
LLHLSSFHKNCFDLGHLRVGLALIL